MKSDPMNQVTTGTIRRPPARGPGSGKEAWIEYACRRDDTCDLLFDIVDQQSAAIRELQGEVALLRRQIAERKPKGGKARLDDATTARIERDLAAGLSQRKTARKHGVSAMTVSRVARRVAARVAATA